MDEARKTIKLDTEAETVTFETARGRLSFDVEPFLGPGLYEVALRTLWTDQADETDELVAPVDGAVTFGPPDMWQDLPVGWDSSPVG